MGKKLLELARKYQDLLVYGFFGVVTTAVNYAIYLPLFNCAGLSATLSSVIAWVGAVLVAFVTNKPFVFHSHSWKREVILPEFSKFVSCRLGSGVLEWGILFLTVDTMHWDGNLWKLIVSVLVVLLNYLLGKLLVFRKK